MTKKKKSIDLEHSLAELQSFVRAIAPALGSDVPRMPEIMFNDRELGGLWLSGKEAADYLRILAGILNATESNEAISPKYVEKLVQNAILSSLDAQEQQPETSLESRLVTETQRLRIALRRTAIPYQLYYPIEGMSSEGLPYRFGTATFKVFDDECRNIVLEALTDRASSDNGSGETTRTMEDWLDSTVLEGKVVAEIVVKAVDSEAARLLAAKELRLITDVISFFSDVVRFGGDGVYLPGERGSAFTTIIDLGHGDVPTASFSSRRVGPLVPMRVDKLRDYDSKHSIGFSVIDRLLVQKRTSLQEQLLSSVQWAGRATVESRNEESFLLFAIALESLVLVGSEPIEIVDRLATRVALLIGSEIDSRKRIYRDVRDLYRVRSKIVHSGEYQVTKKDLSLIRSYAKNCIIKILTAEPFQSMSDPQKDLDDWFRTQVFASPQQ